MAEKSRVYIQALEKYKAIADTNREVPDPLDYITGINLLGFKIALILYSAKKLDNLC